MLFPKRRDPQVEPYSIKQTYGKLLKMVEDAFNKEKPLFALSIYYPYAYYTGDDKKIDPLKEGRQKQVVSLIRIGFLETVQKVPSKHSRCRAGRCSRKLLAWVEVHAGRRAARKKADPTDGSSGISN